MEVVCVAGVYVCVYVGVCVHGYCCSCPVCFAFRIVLLFVVDVLPVSAFVPFVLRLILYFLLIVVDVVCVYLCVCVCV